MTLQDLLTRHGLVAYLPAFEANHVPLSDLPHLSDEDLRADFGMSSFIDRKRFKAMVAELQGSSADSWGGRGAHPPSATPTPGVTRIDGPPAPTPAPARATTDPGATRVDGPGALPERLGSYRILGILGAGGMGTVVRARHVNELWAAQNGGDVAIKLIHPHIAAEASFQARFVAEAALGRTIQHPAFVPTYDVISEGPWLGTVMALVAGEPLTRKIRPGGLPVDEVVRLLAPVADALDHLHAKGIVHRDVKPDNIVVRRDGTPVVLDLGIAKVQQAGGGGGHHTRAMTAMGTSAWMAPEQADAASVDAAADRYALGLVAYALLSGRMPWDEGASDLHVHGSKMSGQLVPLGSARAGLPAHVGAAVMKMLAVTPGERFGTCAEFVGALRAPADPFETWTVAGHTFKMRIVEPCTFVMGSPEDESGRRADETQHEVTLTRSYAIGVVPVTQALWTAVMGRNPSTFKDGPEAPQRPVESVSWHDALRFCNAASAKAGLRPVYTIGAGKEDWDADAAQQSAVFVDARADGFRLPTEAEWECAARAGARHVYAGGDDLDAVGWFGNNSGNTTHPVARKRANAWGLYDMSGNVWECCEDIADVVPSVSWSGAQAQAVVPSMGVTVTVATVSRWKKRIGDFVRVDEGLAEVASDKATLEVTSPVTGRIIDLLFPEGAQVNIGQVIARIEEKPSVKQAIDTSASTCEPTSSVTGAYCVHRGGSWRDSNTFARAARRYRRRTGYRSGYLGLRLVRTISQPSNA